MHNALIHRLLSLIGQPGEQKFDSLRRGPVLEQYYGFYGTDIHKMSRSGTKPSQVQLTEGALEQLGVQELLDLYETAILAYHKDLT